MMKHFFSYFNPVFLFLISVLLFTPGCLKDHCTHTTRYKVYTPIYQPITQIRKAVKAEQPRELRQTGKIYYHNGYLFLNEVNEGIHIIDDRDPSAPKNIAFINIPGNLDMAARGNILYADSYIDMLAIDISDPSHITVTKRTKNVFTPRSYNYGFHDDPNGRGIITGFNVKDTLINRDCDLPQTEKTWFYDVAGGVAFLAANYASKTTAPSVSRGGSMAKFTTFSNYLYTIKGIDSLFLYDLSQPRSPELTGGIAVGRNIETIFPYKHYLFIGASNGMYIYDASHPAAPVLKSRFMHFFACDPVVAQGNYAYVTLRIGATCPNPQGLNVLQIVNIQDVNSPQLESTLSLNGPKGLAIDGDHLIVCDPDAGIRFIDVSDKTAPKIVTTVKGVEAFDAITLNGLLIIVAKDGLYQYNYGDFEHPELLSKINISAN